VLPTLMAFMARDSFSAFAASRSVAKVKGSEFVPAFRPVKSNSWYNQIRDGNIGVCLDQNSPIFSTFL
jgi:hypothetical protein